MPARLYQHQIVQCDAPQTAMHLGLPNEYARAPFYAPSPRVISNDRLIFGSRIYHVNAISPRNPLADHLVMPPKLRCHGKLKRELTLLMGKVAHWSESSSSFSPLDFSRGGAFKATFHISLARC